MASWDLNGNAVKTNALLLVGQRNLLRVYLQRGIGKSNIFSIVDAEALPPLPFPPGLSRSASQLNHCEPNTRLWSTQIPRSCRKTMQIRDERLRTKILIFLRLECSANKLKISFARLETALSTIKVVYRTRRLICLSGLFVLMTTATSSVKTAN